MWLKLATDPPGEHKDMGILRGQQATLPWAGAQDHSEALAPGRGLGLQGMGELVNTH